MKPISEDARMHLMQAILRELEELSMQRASMSAGSFGEARLFRRSRELVDRWEEVFRADRVTPELQESPQMVHGWPPVEDALSGWWYLRPGETLDEHSARLKADPRWKD